MAYDGSGAGKLVPATANEVGGKYYFSARAEVPYESVTDVNRWLAFGDKAITPGWANRLWWATVGKAFQPTTNKSSSVSSWSSTGIFLRLILILRDLSLRSLICCCHSRSA
jgi:hypothetical protein